MEVADMLCKEVPHEPDAHALKLLLLHARPTLRGPDAQQAAEAHIKLLRCDPSSLLAVEVPASLSLDQLLRAIA